jgi:hypothetical protein
MYTFHRSWRGKRHRYSNAAYAEDQMTIVPVGWISDVPTEH